VDGGHDRHERGDADQEEAAAVEEGVELLHPQEAEHQHGDAGHADALQEVALAHVVAGPRCVRSPQQG
jgi:hypothetical protein